MFAMFAIKTCRMNENKIRGHLPREISRATKFLLDRGANITNLSSTHYRRSPLFQRGLEIPCTVKVCFPASIKPDMLIWKYKEIVEGLYIQPKNEVMIGCLIEINDYDKDKNSIGLPMKRRKKDVSKKLKQRKASSKDKTKDIRTFFKITEKSKIYRKQFVIFNSLSYCFEDTIRFDVKVTFTSRPVLRLIRWCN